MGLCVMLAFYCCLMMGGASGGAVDAVRWLAVLR